MRSNMGISFVEKAVKWYQATLAAREATISELINRDACQQDREKNWRECFEEFKDLANGVERKYLQSHAIAIKDSLDLARQDAARLREALAGALNSNQIMKEDP